MACAVWTWFLWWRFLDKKRLTQILIFGFWIAGITTAVDVIGVMLGYWGYGHILLPSIPSITLSLDLCLVPVVYMLGYQFFPRWKEFLIASLVLTSVVSFIGEPFLVLSNIYLMYKVTYVYDFPTYLSTALFSKWLTDSIMKKQQAG